MRRLQLRLVILCACALSTGFVGLSTAHAVEYGLNFDNRTEVRQTGTDNGFSYSQDDVLRLWLRIHPIEAFRLDAQGAVGFEPGEELFPDLEVLSVSGRSPIADGVAGYEFGRTVLDIGDGLLVNHPADALLLEYGRDPVSIRFGAGYFGLLRKESVSLISSASDQIESADEDQFFAPRRIVSFLEAGFPELLGLQSLSLTYARQDDLRDTPDGELLDTQYIVASVSGPLSGSWYYRVLGMGGLLDNQGRATLPETRTGYFYFADLSLDWFPAAHTRVALGVRLGSGEDGDVVAYAPISEPPNGTVFQPGLGNVAKIGLSLDHRVFANANEEALRGLSLGFDAAAYMRPTDAPIRETGLSSTAGAGYLGTEGLIRAAFRPFSDVGMTAQGGVFIPRRGSEGFEEDTRGEVQWMARVEFSLAL